MARPLAQRILRPAAAALAAALLAGPLAAQNVGKSYEDRLVRISEILGAVHHLRDICGANEGQLWRDQMMQLLEAESPSGALRARMVSAFNDSYRGYQRTYGACTPSAKTAADRFFTEGAAISQNLAAEVAVGKGEEEDAAGENGEELKPEPSR